MLQKIDRCLSELQLFLFRQEFPLTRWHFSPGRHPAAHAANFDDSAWQVVTPPCLWGDFDQDAWFRTAWQVPKQAAGLPLHLLIDIADTHGEALLYINGQESHGIDRHHGDVLLTPKSRAGEHFVLALDAYAGRARGPRRFRSALIAVPDDGVRDLYYTLKNCYETALLFDEDQPLRRNLQAALNEAVQHVDWRQPGSDAFRRTAARSARALARQLRRLATGHPATVTPAGHAHIDVTWLWTLEEVKRKCARTFATVLHLMSRYPDFHFVQSQPQLYAFMQADYPALYERIRQRVREGRWEPVGGMWVEADCNVPSGESLVRQLVHGMRFFRDEFGVEVDTLWLPDVFGYSAALPQILKKAGIDYFFTSKIAWNDVNKFPHTSFWWQGIDGTRIFAHLTFLRNVYNSQFDPHDLHEAWDRCTQKDTVNQLLLSYGFGDGGGGPTAAHLENARRLEKMPGLPGLRHQPVRDFFANAARDGEMLPVWWGELYLEYHRGTLTTHAAIKRGNRECEWLLREAEFFAALARWFRPDFMPANLDQAWQLLLLNQFHDILPGSSIPEVYQQTAADYATIKESCQTEIDRAGRALLESGEGISGEGDVLAFCNTLGWHRREPVVVTVTPPAGDYHFRDVRGDVVPHQLLAAHGKTHRLLLQPRVPAAGMTWAAMTAGKGKVPRNELVVSRRRLENRWFRVELNQRGELVSLWDKNSSREVLAPNERGNVLQCFEDMPAAWEAWDLDAGLAEKPLALFSSSGGEVVERGPLRGALLFRHQSKKSVLTQHIIIYRDLPRIDFDTLIDWHETRVVMKVAFPVAVLSSHATYEIQYGSLERPTHRNTSWETAKFEVAGHKWVDLSEGGYGVSLLNDCKYGHDIAGNCLRLTLLRSPFQPDPIDPLRFVQHQAPADQGEHQVVYSLYPHRGDWRQANTVQRSFELNLPVHVLPSQRPSATAPWDKSLIAIDDANVILAVVKPADDLDGVILRLYESQGQRGTCSLHFARPPQTVFVCDLHERRQRRLDGDSAAWRLAYSPYEIITLRLVFA